METPNLAQPDPRSAAIGLRQGLDSFAPEHSFAVLDGAHFEDLPTELQQSGIACRSLFLDGAALGTAEAGPWLVPLADVTARSYVEQAITTSPCGVIWCDPNGEESLHRHLRSLSGVLIPLGVTGGREPADRIAHERVLFRHWDPNVLGAILPILEPAQIERLVGPADAVILSAPDYGGLKRALHPIPKQEAASGPLRFTPSQMEELRRAMLHSSRLRTARFLRGNAPPHFSGVDDEFAWGATLASEQSADELGIHTERGRTRWAYVMLISDGKAAEAPEVRSYITDGGRSPDERVKSLIGHTVQSLRENGFGRGAAG